MIDRIDELYRALDFEPQGGQEGPVRLWFRVEGAVHAYELVWVIDGSPTQDHYQEFAYQLQQIAGRPGSVRQRIVASDEPTLAKLSSRFHFADEVGRYTWISLVNDLFHTDRFCDNVQGEYSHYAALITEQMQAISGRSGARYRYVDQGVREDGMGLAARSVNSFIRDQLLKDRDKPTLMVIQASAGYGKTAFSYELARALASGHMEARGTPFPIFIPFSKYRRFGGVRDILRREIEELKLYGVNSKALLQLVHAGHAVVVLDGFDELMAEVGKTSAKANLAAITEFLQGIANVILTSRSAFLATSVEVAEMMENRLGEETIRLLELVPFEAEQQREYLGNLDLPAEGIDSLLNVLSSRPQLQTLGQSPLLLNTLASLAVEGLLEQEITTEWLYDRHISLLCDRERVRQNHQLSNELQIDFLGGVSRSMYCDNAFHYEPDLLALLWQTEGADLLLRAGYQQSELEGLRIKLMCHALFDSSVSGDPLEQGRGIQFLHPSFRDYFIAKELEAALGDGSPTRELAVISRILADDLTDMLASRVARMPEYLRLLVGHHEVGLRNVMMVLLAAHKAGSIGPQDVEDELAKVLGERAIEGGDLSGMRFEGVEFNGWDFGGTNFNDCHFVGCKFVSCDFRKVAFFGVSVLETSFPESRFNHAWSVNALGVLTDEGIDRLYDNREIRLWLHGTGATVETSDLAVLRPVSEPVEGLIREMVTHIFSKFFPTGSDREQRYRQERTFETSLPPHRKEQARETVTWLTKKGEGGPPRGETLGLSGNFRDDVRALMRDGRISDRMKSLLEAADRELMT